MAKLVSKTYGDALFAVSKEEGRIDEFFDAAKSVKEILRANEDFGKLMNQPKLTKEDKSKIIEETFLDRIPKEMVGMLILLVKKGHAADIISVFDYYIELVKEEKKIGQAYVVTATALNDAQKKKIEKRLLETTKYETFEMDYKVDESLIGGMVVRIGDRVVDSSIQTKLYELTRNLRNVQV